MQVCFWEKKRMPTDRELVAITGVRSTHNVSALVERCVDHVLRAQEAPNRLLPGHLLADLPVLGTVAAGFPSPADEELTDTLSLDAYLITKKEATYLLKVTGDSMIEAGILPGDLLLVERGAHPHDGDIVIAQVDREWTMKYFRRRGTTVFLEAANKAYRPIHAREELQIAAVVRAVIRKY
jgi:SOS regulatory protein LexA